MKKQFIYGWVILLVSMSSAGFAQDQAVYKVGQWNGGVRGQYMDVYIQDDYAFTLVYNRGLVIADIGNPSSPLYVGECHIPGHLKDIGINGNYAYVTAGEDGLRVIDISNPSAPAETGYHPTTGDATFVAVNGSYGYVTDGNRLNVFDVSNPTAPVRKSYLDFPLTYGSGIRGIAVKDHYVVLLLGSYLMMIDVSNPSAPSAAGECMMDTALTSLAVTGDYAVVSAFRDYIYTLDLSDASNPKRVASVTKRSMFITGIHISGNHAYLEGGFSFASNHGYQSYTQLDILDISDITSPVYTSRYEHPANYVTPEGIFTSNGLAYLATSQGLLTIDVSNPNAPSLTSAPSEYVIEDIEVAGHYAYVAAGKSGVAAVDISNPTSPEETGFCCPGGNIVHLQKDGKYLYAADSEDGLKVMDISTPAAPTLLKNYEITKPGELKDIFINGHYAFLATGETGLRIVDISDPVSPKEVGYYDDPGGKSFDGVVTDGNYAYGILTFGGNTTLTTLDITKPAKPAWVSGSNFDNYLFSLAIMGDKLYAGAGTYLDVLDISSPSSPTPLASLDTNGALYDTHLQGNYLYAACRGTGLQIIDISVPSSPSIKGSYTAIDYSSAVCSDSNYIYITDKRSGTFHILRTQDSASLPVLHTDHTRLNFAYVLNHISSPPPQEFRIKNTGGGQLDWALTEDASWLFCSRYSGSDGDAVRVTVLPDGLTAGEYSEEISIKDPNAINSPVTVTVVFTVMAPGTTTKPFGEFATPADNSIARGSIPVTGWVLDDVGVSGVALYRGSGNSLTYIGNAVFVAGARPDVELAYPGYPMNDKAGWGYMLLTNYLPNKGNGTFNLHAIATDYEGNQTTLGTRTIVCDNANAVKPFGAIETPEQGGLASFDEFLNWGWALTPQPNTIPIDGSTISVWVDGVELGNPVYNLYREDIAAYFPGYNNSSGAVGYFYLDTTHYENGIHSIQWTVTDSAGNTDGIGSRYFTIVNSTGKSSDQETAQRVSLADFSGNDMIPGHEPLAIKKGFRHDDDPLTVFPDNSGEITIELRELERLVIHLPETASLGIASSLYQAVGRQRRPLPSGSTLNPGTRTFSWIPGPGYLGQYVLVLLTETPQGVEKQTINVIIKPACPL